MKRILIASVCSAVSVMAADTYAASPLPGGKHDNHAPIEVTSDALEVQQEKNLAIFTGHVVVIQGDTRMKADKMTVYYRHPANADKDKDKTAAPVVPAAVPNEQGAIEKIDAVGGVFLTTPEETASGDTGTYDVEHQEVHLNDHVILTRGQNVLKGDTLVYNFETGESTLNGKPQPASGNAAPGKERVRALFVPEQKDKPQ